MQVAVGRPGKACSVTARRRITWRVLSTQLHALERADLARPRQVEPLKGGARGRRKVHEHDLCSRRLPRRHDAVSTTEDGSGEEKSGRGNAQPIETL